ncbi:MAG: PKD domain-containing protein [Chloroflexaceae bacterium]|nr:PKD domain-containing protein [Chloroflexaceae bacterium]
MHYRMTHWLGLILPALLVLSSFGIGPMPIGTTPAPVQAAVPELRLSGELPPPSPTIPIAADVRDGNVTAQFDGERNNYRLGTAVSTAGDINGDGLADLIIGAPGNNRLLVYLGNPDLSQTQPLSFTVGAAGFGSAVSLAGDTNGDGLSELLIGAPGVNRAYVYRFDASRSRFVSVAPAPISGGLSFGTAVATAGDVNGDGFADIIIGAPDVNQASVYSGASLASAPTPIATLNGSGQFGATVDTAGDVNGDGFADIIVGAPGDNEAYIYLGSATGISNTPALTLTGTGAFGTAVATAGDVNGDGFSDIIVGAPEYEQLGSLIPGGAAFVYYGGSTGIVATSVVTLSVSVPSPVAGDQFGATVSTAGDLNGDGLTDLVIGAPGRADDTGEVHLYYGQLTPLSPSPNHTLAAPAGTTSFGAAVNTAGDLNGDGLSAIIVGAPTTDGAGTARGRALLYAGAKTPVQATANLSLSRAGQPSSTNFGHSFTAAGDLNGDGFGDVATAAPNSDAVYLLYGARGGLDPSVLTPTLTLTETGRFGASMGGAGDLNGDGFDDLIIGAPTLAISGTNQGRVYAYLGSPDGLNLEPVWMMDGESSGDQFGASVAMVGDVNSDGYMDVLIGAPNHTPPGITDTQRIGKAYLYYGTPDPPYLSTSPDWVVLGTAAEEQVGRAVGAAGDLNGDGIADLVVSAQRTATLTPTLQVIGEAYVFYSRGAGPQISGSRAVGSRANADLVLSDNIISENFGEVVGSAGDVNGDGYADLLLATAPSSNADRTYRVYYGSLEGIGTDADWRVDMISVSESRQTAAGLGDVNGDGYADVLVSNTLSNATNFASRMQLFLGSADGLPTTASQVFTFLNTQSTRGLGFTVGSIGDVNGDGFADIGTGFILGARLDIFYGNGGSGVPLRPQQRRGSQPNVLIGVQGNSTPFDQIRLSAVAQMPLADLPVRLEYQMADLGQSFDSPSAFTGIADPLRMGGVFSPTLSGLEAGGSYHWRMRLLYPNGNRLGQLHSRWFAPPRGGLLEEQVATGFGLSLFNRDVQQGLDVSHIFEAELGNATATGYRWDFGDSSPITATTAPTITYRYALPGSYTAQVTAEFTPPTSPQNVERTARTLVRVPGVILDLPDPVFIGQSRPLTATLFNRTPLTYTWTVQLADGATTVVTRSTGLTETNVLLFDFTQLGLATVTVQADTPEGPFVSSRSFLVNELPVDEVQIASSAPDEVGETTTITITALGARPGISVLSTTVDLGDSSDLLRLPQSPAPETLVISHTYQAQGVYTLTAVVSNGFVGVTATHLISITDVAISQPALSVPLTTTVDSLTTLVASVQRGTGITYTWNFTGAGQTDVISGAQGITNVQQFRYPAVGTYNPQVVIANSISGPVTLTAQIDVLDQPITGLVLNVPANVAFGATAAMSATVQTGTNVIYTWDYTGDGEIDRTTPAQGRSDSTSFTFPAPGTYTVTVTVRNGGGPPLTAEQQIQVGDAPIEGLQATADPTTVAVGTPVNFAASVQAGSNVSYSWNFGDGNSASGANVSYSFTRGGTFNVVVTATNGAGSVQQTVTVQVTAPELAISKQANRAVVPPLGLLEYTIAVSNSGNVVAQNLVITDVLGSDIDFVLASDGGVFNLEQRTVRWNVPELRPGQLIVREFTVRVTISSGTVRNDRFGVSAEGVTTVGRDIVLTQVGQPSVTDRVYLPFVVRE